MDPTDTTDSCKLSVLFDRYIFSSSGVTQYAPSIQVVWDSRDLARRAAQEAITAGEVGNEDILKRWASLLAAQLKKIPIFESVALYERYESRGIPVTSALIASAQTGVISVSGVNIYMHSDKGRQPSFEGTARRNPAAVMDEPRLSALGEQEFLTEFLERKTDRAKAEQVKFEKDLIHERPNERHGFIAQRLVELGIKYAVDPTTLAGPIDVVEMDSSGKISWIKRKAMCGN